MLIPDPQRSGPPEGHARAFLDQLNDDAHREALAAKMVPPGAVVPVGLNHISRPLDVIAKSTGLLRLGGGPCD